MTFTQGEWTLGEENVGGGFNIYCGPLRVAHTSIQARVTRPDTRPIGEEEAKANARLASASPNMLRALQRLIDRYVGLVESGDAGFWDAEAEQEVIAARAAIAKATGAA